MTDEALADAWADEVWFATHFPEYSGAAVPEGAVDAGSFIFDRPPGIPSVWGDDEREIIWAVGEPMMIAGPQGVGKTTDAGQLAYGLAGVPGFEEMYGQPIHPLPLGKRVLYLALDRPDQIARALRRMVSAEHRALVAERMIFRSEMPADVLRDPQGLAEWCVANSVGAVIIDSLKDVVGKLSDEEVGATINHALQACVRRGVQVCVLHHNRKANSENRKPKTLADVHGSENLTRGLGSVVCLFGSAGDVEIEFTHLKQPAEPVGPFVLRRDHITGRSTVDREGELNHSTKATRERDLKAYYIQAGGPGVGFTVKELAETKQFGSQRTLEGELKKYMWLESEGEPGKAKIWRMTSAGLLGQS